MDHGVIKKRLNTFKTPKGTLKNVSDEVVIDVLRAWENWSGPASEISRDLGLTKMQMVNMIKKAKRLIKKGIVVESEFREIKMDSPHEFVNQISGSYIELTWPPDKTIRFTQVDHLIDFLKKVA